MSAYARAPRTILPFRRAERAIHNIITTSSQEEEAWWVVKTDDDFSRQLACMNTCAVRQHSSTQRDDGGGSMKTWRGLMVVICVVGCFAPTASAQFLPGISEITGFGGTVINGTNETTAGVAVTMNVSPQMGLEGEVGVIFSDDEQITVSGNAILNLGYGTSYIVPYLTGGAGLINNGGTEIALNLGGGFKMFVEPSIALRGDFRVFLTTESGDVSDLERFYGGVEFLF